MTTAAMLPPRLRKEIRGLLPAWLTALVLMVVAAVFGGRLQPIGLIAYFIGAVALGALSIGHEYTSRTLALLLAQPARRERLLVDKLIVLALMLLVLCAVSIVNVFDLGPWASGAPWTHNWWALPVVLPLLCGLTLAPLLTMMCGSALAGIVFALAIPAAAWIASDLTSALIYGGDLSALSEASSLALEMFWRAMAIVSIVAAAWGCRLFMRLEAIDSRGLDVNLPAWLSGRTDATRMTSAPAAMRRRATWLLLKKELRLQQLTFAVSGLYIAGWAALSFLEPISSATRTTLFYTLTIFHAGAMPLLAGSLASAEERQLGTLEWHALLPVSGRKQWLIKAGVALGIALTLTLGLPVMLLAVAGTLEMRGEVGNLASWSAAYVAVLVVAASLYVSSLCGSGLRALLVSLPVALVILLASVPVAFVTSRSTNIYYSSWNWSAYIVWQNWLRVYRNTAGVDRGEVLYLVYGTVINVLVALTYLGALWLLLRFGRVNHRSAERGAGRIGRQMTRLAAFLAIGLLLLGGMTRLYAAGGRERMRAQRLQLARVSGVAMDDRSQLVKDYSVAVFDYSVGTPTLTGFRPARAGFFVNANTRGEFDIEWLQPGRYAFVAVVRGKVDAQRDAGRDLLARLRPLAVPLTVSAGDSKTLNLLLLEGAVPSP